METLRAHLSRAGALRKPDAIGWCVRLAKRIEQLHNLGVAHGNISLECLLVASTAPSSRGVLIDIRRAPASVAFHSPERAQGGQISPADDAWAIAMTLFTALTGKNPYEGGRPEEVRARISGGPPPALPVSIGDPELQRILARALSRDPGARFPKVSALREALEARMPPPRIALAPLDEEDDTDSVTGGDDDDDDHLETAMFKPNLAALTSGVRPAAGAPPPGAAARHAGAGLANPRPGAPAARVQRPTPQPRPEAAATPHTTAAKSSGTGVSVPVLDPALAAIPVADDDENANTIIAKPNPVLAQLRANIRAGMSPAEASAAAGLAGPGQSVTAGGASAAQGADKPADHATVLERKSKQVATDRMDAVPPYHAGLGSPDTAARFSEPQRLNLGPVPIDRPTPHPTEASRYNPSPPAPWQPEQPGALSPFAPQPLAGARIEPVASTHGPPYASNSFPLDAGVGQPIPGQNAPPQPFGSASPAHPQPFGVSTERLGPSPIQHPGGGPVPFAANFGASANPQGFAPAQQHPGGATMALNAGGLSSPLNIPGAHGGAVAASGMSISDMNSLPEGLDPGARRRKMLVYAGAAVLLLSVLAAIAIVATSTPPEPTPSSTVKG